MKDLECYKVVTMSWSFYCPSFEADRTNIVIALIDVALALQVRIAHPKTI